MPLPLASRRPKRPVPQNRTSRFRVLRTHTEWDSPASSPRFPKHLQGEKEWPRSPRTGSGRQRAASRARPLPQYGLLGQRSARSTCSRRALTYASGHEPLHSGSPGVGLGRSSSGGERRKGKGRGLQATVPGEPGRGPAPQPRAGKAQNARARA